MKNSIGVRELLSVQPLNKNQKTTELLHYNADVTLLPLLNNIILHPKPAQLELLSYNIKDAEGNEPVQDVGAAELLLSVAVHFTAMKPNIFPVGGLRPDTAKIGAITALAT